MSAPFCIKLRKVEKAYVAYLETFGFTYNGAPVEIACGKASALKTAPLIVVYAEREKPDPDNSGNGAVTVHIMVKTPLGVDVDGVDPVSASDTLTASVFDACLPGKAGDDTALCNLLNAQNIADFTAMQNRRIGEEASVEDGQVWVETLTQEIYCAPASGL